LTSNRIMYTLAFVLTQVRLHVAWIPVRVRSRRVQDFARRAWSCEPYTGQSIHIITLGD
jgi:hypothetical protein